MAASKAKSAPAKKRTASAKKYTAPAKKKGAAVKKKNTASVARPRSAADRKERVAAILERLDQDYPDVKCALHHRNAWELLVATILSAQCTDVRVNMVTPGLFQKYPTVADMAAAPQAEMEQEIKTTGFFRNKSKSLIGAAKKVLADFGGKVPDNMDDILSLPGVARKTANVVLGSWFGKATGVVVDTHVQRIARRLDLTKADDPKKIEQDLIKALPQDRWVLFAHQIIHHGRQVCVARKPRCAECHIEDLCYAKDKTV